jgi:putative ABC transport system permease protein
MALEQVLRLPGVVSVAWASTLPLVDGPRAYWTTSSGGALEAYPTVLVSDSYFRTMQLDIVKGRGFESADDVPYATALIVNAALAARLFPDSPVSPRLFDAQGTLHPVVGVVADGRLRQMESAAEPTVFRPLSAEFSWYLHLVVRGTVDASVSIPRIRATLDRIDQASMFKEQSLASHLDGVLGRDRIAVVLMRACGALVMLLSVSGAYLLADSIALRRKREMAVRLALGSTRHGLVAAMIQRALAPTMTGVCLGAVAGYAAMPAVRLMIGSARGSDLVVFGEVAAAVLGLSLVATAIPALVAARAVDPISTLR